MNVSLSLSEPIDSLPYIDNVLVESVDKLVDPIDDQIDSSSKIDLCPPSLDTYALNASSVFCNDCVDQPVCECSSLVEGSCNVIKEPQFGGNDKNVDHFIRSDSLSMFFVADPIACFAHRDHVLEDVEITPSDVPSRVNHESSIVLDNYTYYNNPLWCEDFPPKDGNLFLEDESTLVGKDYDEEKSDVCFPIPFSSWCVPIINGMTPEFESISSNTHENTLEEVELRDTLLYYLFTYDDAHVVEWNCAAEDCSGRLVEIADELGDPPFGQLIAFSVLPLSSSHSGSLGGTVLFRELIADCSFSRLLIRFLQSFAYWNEGRFMSFRRIAKLNSAIRRIPFLVLFSPICSVLRLSVYASTKTSNT
uniref:Uncharacterized protein n=1 Tax=Solanum tuberosum TaxID=4113 RepID=M1D8P3_SOLTU